VIVHDNTLINTHMVEAARRNGASRLLYTSSACVYPGYLQASPDVTPLSGSARKFVRGYGPGGCVPSCQALGSFKYRPQAQSRASWGVPMGSPLGRTESW
jgi:hypothetical protein